MTDPTPKANNPESWLECLWQALNCYREDCIPEGQDDYDEDWNEICTAMAWIRSALGLPDEVHNGDPDQPLRTFEVTIDVVGRYEIRVDAPDPDQAIDFATTRLEQRTANITFRDEDVTTVDCEDITKGETA